MENHYRMILNRIDSNITSVNTKGAMLVAFNTFLFGSIIVKYSEINCLISGSLLAPIFDFVFLCILTFSLISVFFVGLAVYPYLKSGNSSKSQYHSKIFFNSIAEYKDDSEFLEGLDGYDQDKATEDLKRQIYILSKGLKKKFKYISWAMILFFINLLALLFISIQIVL